ncbi:MAG TPA: glycosyltransferase [Polyangiaceae bacterium]|nr:glycosyltransferase [Polyangiaceae bacterium]
MRVLFVTPFLPSPPRFGGQRRLDGLMRSLAKSHEVSVVSFNASDEFEQASLDATRDYCKHVVTFRDLEFKDARKKRLLQAASMLSPRSFEHHLMVRHGDFQKRLRALVGTGEFDIVQVEFAQMAAFSFHLPKDRRFRTVLDEHNIEYDIVRRTAEGQTSSGRRLYAAVDWRKLKLEERRAWRRLDGVAVTSDRDAEVLRQEEPNTELAVVPNGVDVLEFQPSAAPSDESANDLLFFGAMNYFPNSDGILDFVKNTWPLILARRPKTKLWIVGPGADDLMHLRGPNVEVTGFVDQIGPYIERAAAVVVPLRLGGGTRLKIVEAMAKAKAIVSTRIGAEGIDVIDGQHALLADEPQAFADQVERVLSNRQLAIDLGKAARQLAVDRYSWPAVVSRLERFYDKLLSQPPKR